MKKATKPQAAIEEREADTDLPEGWESCGMEDISDLVTSGSRDWSKFYSNRGAYFVRSAEINDFTLRIAEAIRVALPARVEGKRSLIEKDDILVTITGANVGKCARVDTVIPEAYVSQSVALIKLKQKALAPFVYCAMRAPNVAGRQLTDMAYGVGRPVLSLPQIKSLRIPLAPLAEQHRILEQIENVFSRVSTANDRLARVPKILKAFRQSVLAAACSGRLTGDWRTDSPEDRDADLPAGWHWISLSELVPKGGIFDGPFGSNLKTADYTGSGVRVIRMENIGWLSFVSSKQTFISKEKYASLVKHTVGEGDIIFASFIEDAVRTCVLPQLLTKAIAKADCFCIRPKPGIVDCSFLALQLTSRESYDSLHGEIHGATRPRVNTTQLKQLPIRICSLPEQYEIVRRVETLFKLADKIEERVNAATKRADKLTQSILAKAFRGELVPTEAELARKEGRAYEPASALLARIQSARENTAASSNGTTRKRRAAAAGRK